jgi:transcriptional regulator with XRE-family HTH domain
VEAPTKQWIQRMKPGTVLLPGLERVRNERRLSIRDLAEAAELSPDTVWRLEKQRRAAEPRTRKSLARALGTTIKELRTPDEEANAN